MRMSASSSSRRSMPSATTHASMRDASSLSVSTTAAFAGLVVEVVHERAVDLHEVRVQRGDAAQRAVAGARVVDGDERAARAQLGERGAERVEVGVGLLGDLEDHGVEPVGARRTPPAPRRSCTARGLRFTDRKRSAATCGRASSTSRTICASSAPPMP